jgi:superfamily II DNA/RNA helicase
MSFSKVRMSFSSLGLSPALLALVQQQGFEQATPIQAQAIPAVLAGRDVRAQAPTGSGKTAAFGLPLLQGLIQDLRQSRSERAARGPRRCRALVLAPTRELALQVGEQLQDWARELSGSSANPDALRVAIAFGGVSINPQLMGLRGGCDVMVATPGRLLDLLDHKGLHLDGVQTLVLDEADRLLDLGFAQEWQALQQALPARRQNLLFSATYPKAVVALADGLLHEPAQLRVEPTTEQRPDIRQRAIQVDAERRTALLRHLLASEGWERLLVFVASGHTAQRVANKLWANGIKAASLHGELSQGTRREVLAQLREGRLQVLVATDVAARGLDIPELPAVLNYELPRAAADYVHRIGRTGRAGRSGVALSFICADSPTNAESHFRLIEKRQGERVPREQIAGFEPQAVATPAEAVGGIKGQRKSKKDKLREAAAQAQEQAQGQAARKAKP